MGRALPMSADVNEIAWRDLSVMEIMDHWPATLAVFMRHRMLCIGCMVAPFHTLSDACLEHHLDEQQIIEELRDSVQ